MSNRAYHIIEPPIYERLNWDMDLIVACLEVIRRRLPEEFKEFSKSLEYDLLSLENPHGGPDPVIGIYVKGKIGLEKIQDDIVEDWIEKIGIDEIKKEASKLEVLTWDKLKRQGSYPGR